MNLFVYVSYKTHCPPYAIKLDSFDTTLLYTYNTYLYTVFVHHIFPSVRRSVVETLLSLPVDQASHFPGWVGVETKEGERLA